MAAAEMRYWQAQAERAEAALVEVRKTCAELMADVMPHIADVDLRARVALARQSIRREDVGAGILAQLTGAVAEAAEAQELRQRVVLLHDELLAAQGALEDFGAHEDGCEWRPHMDAELDCTCGLVEAKERARKAVQL